MNKCFYCNKQGKGYNPYEHTYYCRMHALKKMNDYINELNQSESSTLKDGFIKVVEPDLNLIDVTLNTKTGEVSSNANNNWQ